MRAVTLIGGSRETRDLAVVCGARGGDVAGIALGALRVFDHHKRRHVVHHSLPCQHCQMPRPNLAHEQMSSFVNLLMYACIGMYLTYLHIHDTHKYACICECL
jgi:hypothetical protein